MMLMVVWEKTWEGYPPAINHGTWKSTTYGGVNRKIIYIWAPLKILYVWVVAVVMVIAFGAAYCFPGFCRNQNIQNRLGSIEELFVGVRCFSNSWYCFHFALMSFHVPFMLHSFPVMFLSFACIFLSFCNHFLSSSFHLYSFFNFPFRFLSCSFQCACMSFHLPFILHSFPFISFLRLWKWLYGLARGPSAANGYR